ncbi:MAG TPA: hypothetical protein VFG63_06435 [Nocardioidaceae bacterium]|nr:hypothetical protein [Nocardioidaceae bacterium]
MTSARPVSGPRFAGWLLGAVALALVLRAPFLLDPPEPDEAGYLLVARHWQIGDPSLYGHFWVDRPPLLLLLYKTADTWGAHGVRILGCVAVAVLVLAAAAGTRAVTGRRAAGTSAVVAAALGSSYALGAYAVDGELLAAALVTTSCAATLWAVYRSSTPGLRFSAAVLAGIAGTAAVLTKQNFADALIFAIVLIVAQHLTRARDLEPLAPVLAGGLVGIIGTLAAVLLWVAASGVGLGDLVYAAYGFRLDAATVIGRHGLNAPADRAGLLVLLALASGLAMLLVLFAWSSRHRLRAGHPVSWAVTAMIGFGVVGIVAGGSYWQHYLIQLVPAAALGAGLVAPWAKWCTAFVVAASVAAAGVGTALGSLPGEPEASAVTTGHWLGRSSVHGDTVVVTYGHANVVLESRLSSPYRYLWSLPTRVLDPHLALLTATLAGPHAPTWIVEWNDFDTWQIDDDGRLAAVVHDDYHRVASVCGHHVYLHNGLPRQTVPAAGPCGDI